MTSPEYVRANFQRLLKTRKGVHIDVLMLGHPAFGSLQTVLEPDEVIEGYCLGPMEDNCRIYLPNKWLVLVSNLRIILLMKGLISGLVCHSIPLHDLDEVTVEQKWLSSRLSIKSASLDVRFYQVNKTDMSFFLQAYERVGRPRESGEIQG